MKVKELGRLSSLYDLNRLYIKSYENDLDEKLKLGWNKMSIGIVQINKSIEKLKSDNEVIKIKLLSISDKIDFS
jgi:hypothetical protein